MDTRRDGKFRLVEYNALTRHRSENIRIEAAREAGRKRVDLVPSRRKVMAEAELKEMDLAQRRGHLVIAAEVDGAARNALAVMKAGFDRAIEPEAASLSVKYGWDERALRLGLKAFVASGLDHFHREMLKLLDDIRDGVPGARGEAARDDDAECSADRDGGFRLQ
ncbi:MAG: hypothetical protein K8H74_10655 [Notoacmeibacter sp.]|nr:hypothetical protein [Notoacmeibacter sp.]